MGLEVWWKAQHFKTYWRGSDGQHCHRTPPSIFLAVQIDVHIRSTNSSLVRKLPPSVAEMPAKNKGSSTKPKEAAAAGSKTQTPAPAPEKQPRTIRELEWQRYWSINPLHKIVEEKGIAALSPIDKRNYLNLELIRTPGQLEKLSKKSQKQLWKELSEASLSLREGVRPTENKWGFDKHGRNVGDYTIEEYNKYRAKQTRLSNLKTQSWLWGIEREGATLGIIKFFSEEPCTCTEDDIEEERALRREMAALNEDLYGISTGVYATDPDWDDVAPLYQDEPAGALAAIAYPDDYAEAMGYLRAVMAHKEHTPRCLKLTEHIINMNPAHYTVWLYRFNIVKALKISIPDEISWLNDVAREKLKNYQIWHHRQLLLDEYYDEIQSDQTVLDELRLSELAFLDDILTKDNKNYHVWSYRQYMVRKLDLWNSETELESIEDWIEEDVRNNSAWSHRFCLVFSNPTYTTLKSHSTEHDPLIPANIIDREIIYAQMKIDLAPQNQSPWNYLRGVLVKGGRPLSSVQEHVGSFIVNLGSTGKDEEAEEIKSSHALDLLADICQETGDIDMARLCLRRLAEKWDPIRKGYWEYRAKLLTQE
ncbi:prenyltransferase alpha subunit, partial [Xylariaceae sp. FL0255]